MKKRAAPRIWRANATLKRQKSINSHAVDLGLLHRLALPQVAALRVSRHGQQQISRARTPRPDREARSAQSGAALSAASTASSASASVAFAECPRT